MDAECFSPLSATVLQYITLSDGQKNEYTDLDALTEYGSSKILSPDLVSYYNLYVNGVIQPPVNYQVTEGLLTFKTSDLPPYNAPIVIEFVILFNNGTIMQATNNYYVARSTLDRLYLVIHRKRGRGIIE